MKRREFGYRLALLVPGAVLLRPRDRRQELLDELAEVRQKIDDVRRQSIPIRWFDCTQTVADRSGAGPRQVYVATVPPSRI